MLWLAVFGTLAVEIPNFGYKETAAMCLYGFRPLEGRLEGSNSSDSRLAAASVGSGPPVMKFGGLILEQQPFALENPDTVRPASYNSLNRGYHKFHPSLSQFN